jgi:hypothetical protein
MAGRWGSAIWGRDTWYAMPAGWGVDWDVWVQKGRVRAQTLTGYVVEARWTSDSHTPGDGTFRGDIQPGRLALRMVDVHGTLGVIDKLAQIWLCYVPTGAAWCFYVDTVSQPLVAPGDPAGSARVVTASTWPARLTTASNNATRPAETVSSRLTFLAERWNSDTALYLPAVSSGFAVDNHPMTANTAATTPWIQIARDAACNGVFYIEAVRDAAGVGRIVVHYDFWETAPSRTVPDNQIVAGTVTTQGLANLVTLVHWSGTDAGGVVTNLDQYGTGWDSKGLIAYGPMRLWADIPGFDSVAVTTTGTRLLTDRGNEADPYVSSVSFVSGDRRTAAGAPVVWDPRVMVWNDPTYVLKMTVSGVEYRWRVTQTTYRLTAQAWTSDVALVKYTPPYPLPARAALEQAA